MDLISRQAAIDAINHICPVDTEYDCTLLDRVDVRCVLSELPTAEPNDEEAFEAGYTKAQMELKDAYKPRKGEWVAFANEGGELDLRCSVCGEEQGFFFGYFNYCPHCGARMEESK